MSKKQQVRQRQILALLEKTPSMRVNELAVALEVTAETIRRDLDDLHALGRVDRTYGGALLRMAQEPGVSVRHNFLVSERESIARAAVPLLHGAQLLVIGSGATTLHVARRIAVQMNNITVIAHSFGVATVLSINPTISVIMAPGVYHAGEGAVHGAQTLQFLANYRPDWALLGASGLSVEGATDAMIEAAAVYRCMLERASHLMLVADSTKFDRHSVACHARWPEVDHLVTDKSPEGELCKAIESQGTHVCVAADERMAKMESSEG